MLIGKSFKISFILFILFLNLLLHSLINFNGHNRFLWIFFLFDRLLPFNLFWLVVFITSFTFLLLLIYSFLRIPLFVYQKLVQFQLVAQSSWYFVYYFTDWKLRLIDDRFCFIYDGIYIFFHLFWLWVDYDGKY